MNSGFSVRPARPQDAKVACDLIYLTMGCEADWLFTGRGGLTSRAVMESLFIRRGNRLAHNLAWLAEREGQVAGLLLAYPGRILRGLDRSTLWQMLLICGLYTAWRLLRIQPEYGDMVESQPDEYYISNLAVLPEYRGQGIASQLLALAEGLARSAGLWKCSLIVSYNHDQARRLYERLGYSIQASYRYDHPKIAEGSGGYHRMVKDLQSKAA